MAQGKSSAKRVQRLRARKAAGTIFVQFELKRAGVETLIARGLLDDDAANDPAQVRAALVDMLNDTLCEPRQPFRRALKAMGLGLL